MPPPHTHPNVILVITDDQGYADLGCTGNPWLRTPHIDRFHDESIRLADFHVSALCTPTRGALMTGHRPLRNGAWATCWGRSLLGRDEVTMADIFRANAYRTGLFGKWHLGDNYPYRPQDRGFETVVAHKGGGVGQTSDFWGNHYFDDTYFHNGRPVDHRGYCTDIWFDEALRFIDNHRDEPFFAVLSTNAPHEPYLVADRYTEPYAGDPDIGEPAFYGMIANIDENFGRLRNRLAELDLEDNTLLIFMTDNGSSGGCRLDADGFVTHGYNAGMRGKKGSYYDGGHRVPCFLRRPAAGLVGPRDIDEMALHVDLLPTLIDLCGLSAPELSFDGVSLAPLLRGEASGLPGDRIHFLQNHQSTDPPDKWNNAVMTRQWRLVGGEELYDMRADPGQRREVAHRYPEVVARLRDAHEAWWAEIQPALQAYGPIVLGHDAENPARIDAMDVMGDVAWHQTAIVQAQRSTGRWTVEIARAGSYRFSLRRWPSELGLPIDETVSPEEARRHICAAEDGRSGTITPCRAELRLFDRTHSRPVHAGETESAFDISLHETGISELEAWFYDADGVACGAYYVYVERRSD